MTLVSDRSSHIKVAENSGVVKPESAERWHIYVTSRGEVKKINLDALMAGAGAGSAISATDSGTWEPGGGNETPDGLS